MAKRKSRGKRPQAKHRKKSTKSRHERRQRLSQLNPGRKKTREPKIPLTGMMSTFVTTLQAALDPRVGFRLGIIMSGMLLAKGRRTASAWFVAAGVHDDWDRFYDNLICIGKESSKLATAVLKLVVKVLAPSSGARILLALDDSPTPRYGKHVEGAGVHHNPTPGPADGDWLYGHNWVALAWLANHPLWGVIALPLRSLLYVREKDFPKLAEKHSLEFHTKHQLGIKLLEWFVSSLQTLGLQNSVWLTVDGAYAARPFLRPVLGLDVVVVSRLRKDAHLNDLPPAGSHGNRIYGKNRISLTKRAGQPRGWKSITYQNLGTETTCQYKTLLATSRLVGGVIRVVIVRLENGTWLPIFCTDSEAGVCDIIETYMSRWAIERAIP